MEANIPSKKSFSAPSARPADVEYRLARLQACLAEATMYIRSIDPTVFPGSHEELTETLAHALDCAVALQAPTKRAIKSEQQRTEEAAAAEAAKAAKEEAKAAKKAQAAAEKAAAKAAKAEARRAAKAAEAVESTEEADVPAAVAAE